METEILDDNNYRKIHNIQYATFLDRLLASVLDNIILIIPMGALMYFGYELKNIIILMVASFVGILYKPVMEGVWGATLGKMALKVSVVDSDFELVDLGQSFLKNAIYIISGIIGILGHIWLVGTDAFKESEGIFETMAVTQGNPYSTISLIWTLVILVSCFAMLASATKQTLHDRLASTYCVKNATFDHV